MFAPIVGVPIIAVLAALLVAQGNRARRTRGALLRAIEAEAHAEQAFAERPSVTPIKVPEEGTVGGSR